MTVGHNNASVSVKVGRSLRRRVRNAPAQDGGARVRPRLLLALAARPLRVSAERRWRRLLARAEQECGPIDHARACLARPDPSHLSI